LAAGSRLGAPNQNQPDTKASVALTAQRLAHRHVLLLMLLSSGADVTKPMQVTALSLTTQLSRPTRCPAPSPSCRSCCSDRTATGCCLHHTCWELRPVGLCWTALTCSSARWLAVGACWPVKASAMQQTASGCQWWQVSWPLFGAHTSTAQHGIACQPQSCC
jgi:hypothetical protein